MNEKLSFNEFAKPSCDEWKQAAIATLKGADFDKRLRTMTYEEIMLEPIYFRNENAIAKNEAAPGIFPFLRGTELLGYKTKQWQIIHTNYSSNIREFNRKAVFGLRSGETALNIYLDKAQTSLGSYDLYEHPGIELSDAKALDKLFDSIKLKDVPVHFHAGHSSFPLFAAFIAFLKNNNIDFKQVSGSLNYDFLGFAVSTGVNPRSKDTAMDELAAMAQWAVINIPQFRVIGINGSFYRNAGSNALLETAFTLATAVEYIREILKRNINIDAATSQIRFTLATGGNFFMEIARHRAVRTLWALIAKQFGAGESAQKIELHIKSTIQNKSGIDIHTNMLRNSGEAMAAIIGGCSSLEIMPFDAVSGDSDDFSERTARNTQLVLFHEARLADTIDPAGGSWYVENLTENFARRTWDLFRKIEAMGGMAAALEAGFPQQLVCDNASLLLRNFLSRKEILVGVNKYPNLSEKKYSNKNKPIIENKKSSSKPELDNAEGNNFQNIETMLDYAVEMACAGATLADIVAAMGGNSSINQYKIKELQTFRLAGIFEELRNNAVEYKANYGTNPQALLVNFGEPKDYKARNDFSFDFLSCGGFEAVSTEGFQSADEALKTAIAANAKVIVICSSDEKYPDIIPEFARKIKSAAKDIFLVLAGNPIEYAEQFKSYGIDEFIHLKSDIYKTLSRMQKIILKVK